MTICFGRLDKLSMTSPRHSRLVDLLHHVVESRKMDWVPDRFGCRE